MRDEVSCVKLRLCPYAGYILLSEAALKFERT